MIRNIISRSFITQAQNAWGCSAGVFSGRLQGTVATNNPTQNGTVAGPAGGNSATPKAEPLLETVKRANLLPPDHPSQIPLRPFPRMYLRDKKRSKHLKAITFVMRDSVGGFQQCGGLPPVIRPPKDERLKRTHRMSALRTVLSGLAAKPS